MPYRKVPTAAEYPPYFEQYIAKVKNSNDILAQLKKQENIVLDLITALSDKQMNYAYEEGKWSVAELLNHLIDTERIFSFRALSLARGEAASLPGFDDDAYVQSSFANAKSKIQLKEEYSTNRKSTIALFRGFENECVDIMGEANGLKISVRAILYIIAGHEVHHLQVLNEKYL